MQTPSNLRLPPWLTAGQLATAALVLASAAFFTPPLQDAVTGRAVSYAGLSKPAWYLVGAPLFGVWDTLSLLTLSQHYAVLVTLIAFYVSWRLRRLRAPRRARSLPTRLAIEVVMPWGALLALLGFYAAGVVLPRPMVGLELDDPDLVAIDFHSHTRHSHDGWSLFTVERNRAWHEAGGFHAAYITDHYTWAGYDAGRSQNPTRVGEGLAFLSGAEIRIHRRPTNILGERDRYRFALDDDTIYMDPDSLRAAHRRGTRPATLLYTMPGGLEWVVPFTEDEPSGVIAIELNDASPRGLEQVKSQRAEILALADSADLAVLGASNLHGWGRTVASWSVMRIPGWHAMTPESLADVIESELHSKRRNAVTVIERRMPYHGGSAVGVVLTLPRTAWEHLRMLSTTERASWLLWLGFFGLVTMRTRSSDDGSVAPTGS